MPKTFPRATAAVRRTQADEAVERQGRVEPFLDVQQRVKDGLRTFERHVVLRPGRDAAGGRIESAYRDPEFHGSPQ